MIYQFDSRVRYSEVDENRRITLLSILNYFQDCSSFHSEKIGFGIDYLKEKQCAWVLSSWQIVLGELPVFGQEITVQTWPYSFKGFLGERNFCIRDEKGEKLAWANTLWTYVDLKTDQSSERGAGSVCAAREAGYGLCTAKDRPSGRNGKERVLSDRETSH